MLSFGNKEFRNLQEQVLKNAKDIAQMLSGEGVLDEFGIKIVGVVSSIVEIPAPGTPEFEALEYGDAYAVGTAQPYQLYIKTRAGGDYVEDHWFFIGEFPAPGPQGEPGPAVEIQVIENTIKYRPVGSTTWTNIIPISALKGAKGDKGDLGYSWYTTTTSITSGYNTVNLSTVGGSPRVLDLVVSSSIYSPGAYGIVTSKTNTTVTVYYQGSVRGPQGEGTTVIANPVEGADDKLERVFISNKVYSIFGNDNQTTFAIARDALTNINGWYLTAFEQSPVEISGYTGIKITMGGNVLTKEQAASYMTDIAGTDFVAEYDFYKPQYSYIMFADYNIYKPQFDTTNGLVLYLVGKIPTKTSDLTNDSGFITKSVNNLDNYTKTSDLASVATSGSYTDLNNKPSIPTETSDLNNDSGFITKNVNNLVNYTKTSDLANVATSGSYNDLNNKPTIPTETSDLTNDSGFITKSVNNLDNYTKSSDLASVATSGSYTDLSNKPSIPTKTSDLTNDSGFITNAYHDATKQDDLTDLATYTNNRYLHTNAVSGDLEWVQDITSGVDWGDIYGSMSNQADLTAALNSKSNVVGYDTAVGTDPVIRRIKIDGSYWSLAEGAYTSGYGISIDANNAIDVEIDDTTGLKFDVYKQLAINHNIIPTKTFLSQNYQAILSGLASYANGKYLHTNSSTGEVEWANAPTVTWSSITGKPSFATVATSGSYNDLINTPTIPAAVSGTNDGTNWTAITIGSDTYNIPAGGSGSVNIAAGDNIVVEQPASEGDPITIGLNPSIGITNATSGQNYDVTATFDVNNVANVPFKSSYVLEGKEGTSGEGKTFGSEILHSQSTVLLSATRTDSELNKIEEYFQIGSGNGSTYSIYTTDAEGNENESSYNLQQVCEAALNGGSSVQADGTTIIDNGGILSTSIGGYVQQEPTPYFNTFEIYWDENSKYTNTIDEGMFYDLIDRFQMVMESGNYEIGDEIPITIYSEFGDMQGTAIIDSFSSESGNETLVLDTITIQDLNLTDGVLSVINDNGNYSVEFESQLLGELEYDGNPISYIQDFYIEGVAPAPIIQPIDHRVIPIDGTSIIYNNNDSRFEVGYIDYATKLYNKPTFATVATSGSYTDLSNTPNLATVATTGDYDDLTDKPDLSVYALSANLATVATSGSYNDLSNKPTIPTVNNATLTIQKNGTQVARFTANSASNVTANISVPTDTNDLTNGAGFITNTVNNLTNYTLSSSLSTVATSGSYNDLSNKPTIPNIVYSATEPQSPVEGMIWLQPISSN